MPALKNAKHEAFARAIVEGKTGADAYLAAGYKAKPVSAAANAGRLLKNDGISSRIAELKGAAADAAVMGLREVLGELTKLGRANMRDFAELMVADDVVAALEALPPEHAAAIQELTVESYSEPGEADEVLEDQGHGGALRRRSSRQVKRVKFKLHSKPQALSELRRHYEPLKHEHSGKDGGPIETKDVSELSELEVARRLAFLLASAAQPPASEASDGGQRAGQDVRPEADEAGGVPSGDA